MIIDFNITNYCNAKCPTCKRFNPTKYLEITEGLEITHMDFDEYKTAIEHNKEYFKNKTCYFCGEFGDPLMHPRITDFAELANSVFQEVLIYTNGGLSRDTFFNYVIETENNINVRFGIDGLTHEINSIYRINVNTKLAYKNMVLLAKHNKAWWDYTIFEHNRHEIEDVIQFARDHNVILALRCNLRPNKFGINRITEDAFNSYKDLAEKHKGTPRLYFETSWIK
jgi:MoaA/NifB/PqqE/SkfB family radical SAM enzyme